MSGGGAHVRVLRRLREFFLQSSECRAAQARLREAGGGGSVEADVVPITQKEKDEETVKREKQQQQQWQVLHITLNNPERANALSGKMLAELGDAVSLALYHCGQTMDRDHTLHTDAGSSVRCVVLRGAGNRHFCAGSDLNLLTKASASAMQDMLLYMQTVTACFKTLDVPTIALLEGDAIGGGSELVTMTDFQVADEKAARLRFVHARRGLTTGWGGSSRLIHILGPHRAAQMLTSAQLLSATEAHRIGLVSHLAPAGEAQHACEQLTRTLCSNDAQAMADAKLLSLHPYLTALEEYNTLEQANFLAAFARLQQRWQQ